METISDFLVADYYETVEQYYDEDADLGFEDRADQNGSLQRIREDFRSITVKYPFESILEIGCGPGFDAEWFARNYPEKQIVASDISPKMIEATGRRISGLSNARVHLGNEHSLLKEFGPGSFDMIYVYFGALNTVEDLSEAADIIYDLLKPGGHAVLTFVNKWYLREMIVQLLKFRFRGAFARIRKVWGGYSPQRFLPSHCYSSAKIEKEFSRFGLVERKGYSIFYPAWYNHHKVAKDPIKGDKLWEKDQSLQSSFWWDKGEYLLYVFSK